MTAQSNAWFGRTDATPCGPQNQTKPSLYNDLLRTLRVMDVRTENCGCPHQKVCSLRQGNGEKLSDPWAYRRKDQERPREIQSEELMFMY